MSPTLNRRVVNISLGTGAALMLLSALVSLLWQELDGFGFGTTYLLFAVPQLLLWFGALTTLPGLIAIGVHAASSGDQPQA